MIFGQTSLLPLNFSAQGSCSSYPGYQAVNGEMCYGERGFVHRAIGISLGLAVDEFVATFIAFCYKALLLRYYRNHYRFR